jgi:uncharacterized protein with NRDE domain
MCSIILRVDDSGVWLGANRDEMLRRRWAAPGAYWPELPGVVAGRDETAGGTWLGMNRHGVVAAVLNRHGSLGPAPGKHSRGELPLIALRQTTAAAAADAIAALDAGAYRSFNVVTADAGGAYFCAGMEADHPRVIPLESGVSMITSGQPNEVLLPRVARHLPKFQAASWEDWPALLSDDSGPWESALNIPERDGFGTVCSSMIALPRAGARSWRFAGATFQFEEVTLP